MIHSTAVIHPNVLIGKNVHIGAYCVIGGPAEDKKYFDNPSTKGVVILDGARIFDLVTIHSGTIGNTFIGKNACIFSHSHIAHDVMLESDCIIGGGVSLAGHTRVMRGANVSGRSATIPHVVIGPYAFIGAFSLVTKHIPPGVKCSGYPARALTENLIGLQRSGMSYQECRDLFDKEFYELIEGINL
jgi:UDP-N-acetylglucosamine acyltransferase